MERRDRNEEINDLTLFGLSIESREMLKRRFLDGRAKLREVMLFYGVKKKCAEEIVEHWRSQSVSLTEIPVASDSNSGSSTQKIGPLPGGK